MSPSPTHSGPGPRWSPSDRASVRRRVEPHVSIRRRIAVREWLSDASALAALSVTLTDDAWRVREMGAKLVSRHLVADLPPRCPSGPRDPVPRVSAAASRAVIRITQSDL